MPPGRSASRPDSESEKASGGRHTKGAQASAAYGRVAGTPSGPVNQQERGVKHSLNCCGHPCDDSKHSQHNSFAGGDMRNLLILGGVILFIAAPAMAQDTPKAEIFGGYQYLLWNPGGIIFQGGVGPRAADQYGWFGGDHYS